jgi:serine/threonine protein kinase
VLIDDASNVVICDFGLSRMKANATSHTARSDGGGVVGGRIWMAPERLMGGLLKKPCDIYAFRMTLYEVNTCCVGNCGSDVITLTDFCERDAIE